MTELREIRNRVQSGEWSLAEGLLALGATPGEIAELYAQQEREADAGWEREARAIGIPKDELIGMVRGILEQRA